MRKCVDCGTYTFKTRCPDCGKETINPLPPKFSPVDPYGKYRRSMKQYHKEASK
ncbi:MAG: RNA-protein complex protein Nop10 [Methanosarcinales archaeon Met12]|nr:MAG: RNA-protein complex protein Nop10 [Methanosarcinales archaeon Met12]